MNSTDRNFTGSIPALYDRYLGPLIFEPYAADIATRLSYLTSGALLETAAGTGIVTRALIKALADDIRLIATDLNEAMIDYAARQVASPGLSWQKVDAINLPFENASFDAVVCQFGVMFFPDRVSAYREAARVLKPGGRFIFNVWDRIEENDFAYRVSCAMKNLFPQDPPMFLSRTPYGHADLRTMPAFRKQQMRRPRQ